MGAVVDIAAAVVAGRADPVEMVTASLDRIAAGNPRLNAFVALDPERSRTEAEFVRARVHAGERLPLAGVPLAVKDNIFAAGWRVTQGSRLFADHVAPMDAVAVARAKAAGAVVVGITACSEFAAKGVTATPLHGVTRHPMDPALTPGGSSGGSATALGAGLVPAALGTDAGGSGRRPAAHCGLVGFKGTLGAIPYGPGFPEPFWDLGVISPMARDVADVALLFETLQGFDAADPSSFVALDGPPEDVRGLNLAFSPTFGLDRPVDPDVSDAVLAAVEAIRASGWRVEREDPIWPEGAGEAAVAPLQHAGLAAFHGDVYRADPSRIDTDLGAQIEEGFRWTGRDVALALEASLRIRVAVAAFFRHVDLLIGPTTPCVAWPSDRLGPAEIGGVPVPPRGHAVFTPLFNHARVPAISIPCGRGRGGLPVGLQIVGRLGADRTVLAAAAAIEAILRAAGIEDAP